MAESQMSSGTSDLELVQYTQDSVLHSPLSTCLIERWKSIQTPAWELIPSDR